MEKLRTAILISGRGSNMQAIIKAALRADYPTKICCVISNRAEAAGLQFARQNHIPTAVVAQRDYPDRISFDEAITALLHQHRAQLVCLAGFMRLLSPQFVEHWSPYLINIHPSLLPAFKGLQAQHQAIKYGVKLAGCSLHFVTPEMDAGMPIYQIAISTQAGEDGDRFAARLLKAEHICYLRGLELLAHHILRKQPLSQDQFCDPEQGMLGNGWINSPLSRPE